MMIWNNILKFDCDYQQNGELNDEYNWTGYVISNVIPFEKHCGNGKVSSIEGIIVDNQIKIARFTDCFSYKQYIKDFVDERYLFGPIGIYHKEGVVKFTVFPLDHTPIDYEFEYDEEDDCLYGVYYFVNRESINNNYNGFARLKISQEIEDNIDENYINNKINKSNAFYQHIRKISQINEFKKNNIQIHDDDKEKYVKAKEFFKTKNNVLILK